MTRHSGLERLNPAVRGKNNLRAELSLLLATRLVGGVKLRKLSPLKEVRAKFTASSKIRMLPTVYTILSQFVAFLLGQLIGRIVWPGQRESLIASPTVPQKAQTPPAACQGKYHEASELGTYCLDCLEGKLVCDLLAELHFERGRRILLETGICSGRWHTLPQRNNSNCAICGEAA